MTFSIDGGSRGNPGPAGYGVHVVDAAGQIVDELYGAIGIATNNVAEYSGLVAALRYAIDHGCRDITIRSDSLLLVCQMKGEYRVKNPGLKALHADARALVNRLGRVRFVKTRRPTRWRTRRWTRRRSRPPSPRRRSVSFVGLRRPREQEAASKKAVCRRKSPEAGLRPGACSESPIPPATPKPVSPTAGEGGNP